MRLAFDVNSGPITCHLNHVQWCSMFIWSQGPAADESTCAHQKCRATGAKVPCWEVGSRMMEASLQPHRDEACSEITTWIINIRVHISHNGHLIPTEVAYASTKTKKLIIYYQSVSLLIGHIQPGLRCTGGDAFDCLDLESVFKSWTLSVLTSWTGAIMHIDLLVIYLI